MQLCILRLSLTRRVPCLVHLQETPKAKKGGKKRAAAAKSTGKKKQKKAAEEEDEQEEAEQEEEEEEVDEGAAKKKQKKVRRCNRRLLMHWRKLLQLASQPLMYSKSQLTGELVPIVLLLQQQICDLLGCPKQHDEHLRRNMITFQLSDPLLGC